MEANQAILTSFDSNTGLDTIEQLVAVPLQQMSKTIQQAIASEYGLVNQATSHLFDAGGKHIRPMLLLLTSGLTGGIKPESIELAATVEMIHTATLIHDDIVDESPLRRGRISVSSKWGNQVAVLVGDFLYARASTIAAKNGMQQFSQLLAEATVDMCEGEIRQIEQEGNFHISEHDYLEIIRRKTGRLMSVCSELGGLINGITQAQAKALNQYGLLLGMIFQMIDDTLDFTSSLNQLGKPTNHDFANGKMTLPLIHVRDRLNTDEYQRLLSFADIPMTSLAVDWLMNLLKYHNSVEYVRDYAHKLVLMASEQLYMFPDSEYKTALLNFGDCLINRDK